jgi:hypothetical protein
VPERFGCDVLENEQLAHGRILANRRGAQVECSQFGVKAGCPRMARC